MRDQLLEGQTLRLDTFCGNVADIPEESRLRLKKRAAEILLADENYKSWTMDELLAAARRKGWTMEKINQQFKNADRATIIALVKGARAL